MLTLDYARQKGAVDWGVISTSHITLVGVGSASSLAKTFVRMGVGRLTIVDPDTVEARNITSQGYDYADALTNRPKVEALYQECREINPAADVAPIQADFCALPDGRVKELLASTTLLIMATDHHPAQPRGALAGLVCDVPVILASLYRRGRAGEIVFTYPGKTASCYRCITKSRYEYVARNRTRGTGDATGSLPFAAQMLDALVGHLAVSLLHKSRGADHNPYARWIDRLDQRNFVQVRMDPDYMLGDADIFGDVLGHDERVFAFDSIWQSGISEKDPYCPDCHGRGALPVGERFGESTELQQLACGCLAQKGTAETSCAACAALQPDIPTS